MKLKKLICTALTATMLCAVINVPTYAWDRQYGTEYYEQSKTAVTDDMEILSQNDTDSALLYTIREDGSAMITGYAGKFLFGQRKYAFDIPSEIDGHTVTAIADGALENGVAKITGITLPPTIKEIGVGGICSRYLEYLNLNDGLEVIKDSGIFCGESMTSIDIPDSVKYIGSYGINGDNLTSINLPDNLEFLGENILGDTAYARDAANRENEILYCGPYLLAGLKIGYVEDVINDGDPNYPSSPTLNRQIHEWEATGDITIREGTTRMCEDAFGMSEITSVKLPSTLKSIPYLGFYWCENLDNVVIPGNVKEIGDNAFAWNESLTNLTISEGVEKIGEMAFFRCNKLNEVTIPKSVSEIGLLAFGWDYVNEYDVRNENLVIRAYAGSAGEKYARDNGFRCVLIDSGEVIEAGEPNAAADARTVCEKGSACAVKKFKDLKGANGDRAHEAIEFCLDNGIMNGTGTDTFSPDDTITRAQFATMFYRLAGSPATTAANPFTDLTADWYKNAVIWAADNGVVNGTGGTTFSPDDTITREQIAAVFYRYASSKGLDMSVFDEYELTYSDRDDISDYAKEPMRWCYFNYIMPEYCDKMRGSIYLVAAHIAPTRADTALMFRNLAYLLNQGE